MISGKMDNTNSVTNVDSPVFIVGAHRSGSTLLRIMLDHHPQIALTHEFDFTMHLVSGDGEPPDLKSFYAHLALNGSYIRSGFKIDRSLDFNALLNSFLKQARSNKRIVGMSCHANFDRLPYFWPNARYIHLVRDPRDVAPSSVKLGIDGDIYMAAGRWVEAEKIWETLRRRIPEENFIEIRFEDLVVSPCDELTKICQFLGLSYSESMLSYSSHSDYDLPDATVSQRWKNSVPAKDVQLIEAQVNGLLSQRGYSPSGLDTYKVTLVDKIWHRLMNSWRRLRHDVVHGGLYYATFMRLTRKLRLHSLHKKIVQGHLEHTAFNVKKVRTETK